MTGGRGGWDLRAALERTGALLHGHFLLSSGRHAAAYVQCARLLAVPHKAEAAGAALAGLFHADRPAAVVGPALGGVVLAHVVARALGEGVRALFAERSDGRFALRRGFEVGVGERVLVVEDVVTTGASSAEVVDLLRGLGASVVGVGALVHRGDEATEIAGVPFRPVDRIPIPSYEAAACPLCREGLPLVKPGSRPSTAPSPLVERNY